MLDIMDTYNHGDMHQQYGKNGNYNNISIMMNNMPKKVKLKNQFEEKNVLLTINDMIKVNVPNDVKTFKRQFSLQIFLIGEKN